MNIGYSINLCSKLFKNKLNKELEGVGITASQYAVIKDIEINTKANNTLELVTAVDIAERLDMDKPTISGIINRLISKGYIVKLSHPTDKRSSVLRITENCAEKLQKIEEISSDVIQSSIEDIGEQELEIFKTVITKIINNLK